MATYNHPSFIKDDPISIPHRFSVLQDIEIAGFFAAILAWGNRTSIIRSCNRLLELMGNKPYEFITNMTDADAKKLVGFVHRTFNSTDLLFLISFFHYHYVTASQHSLETAFSQYLSPADTDITAALNGFHGYVFSPQVHEYISLRTQKHIASPQKKSACKRLNMYLRWMVRSDQQGVDFGLWKNILPSQLICPIDVHVARVARRFQLLSRTQTDWQAALELTALLKQMDNTDPVKYDYALFGLGVVEKFM